MKPVESLKNILAEIYPLHRTLAADGMDKALEIIGEYMPLQASYETETYPSGEAAWTWRIPERYVVHEAYLETEDGERIVDFADNPLHLVSYSPAQDRWLTWEELEPHLYFSEKRPQAIPWKFKYYLRDWGFCLSKNQFDRLRRKIPYHAVIKSEFVTAPGQGLRIGHGVIHPQDGAAQDAGELLICTHTCHPMQANDDAAGVVTALEVARRLAENPLPAGAMSVRFLFCPETIGSIAYLSRHEDLIPNFKGSIFIEMPGNRNQIALQRTRQDDHLMDRIGRYVLEKHGVDFREGEFAQVVANDERVINGPGVNVPCVSISRYPYDEYHTSDDNLDIIHEELMLEIADIIEEITRITATNYMPRRKFRGPVFLSGYGLWVDWQENWDLNRAIEKIMMSFEGDLSVFEIAENLKLDYWEIRAYIERFRAQDLIEACPMPSSADTF